MAGDSRRDSMKRLISLVLIVLWAHCLIARESNAQELFLRAQQLYVQHNYQAALDCYQAIKHKGWSVHYNMGHCFYKLEDPTQALICWKRAQQIAPFSAALAIDSTACQLTSSTSSWITTVVRTLAETTSLLVIQLIFLLCWFLWWAVMMLKRGGFKYLLTIVFTILTILVFVMLIMKYKAQQSMVGIVVDDEVPVFVGPNNNYHVISFLPKYGEVKVCEIKGDWYHVRNGVVKGWVPAEAVTIV